MGAKLAPCCRRATGILKGRSAIPEEAAQLYDELAARAAEPWLDRHRKGMGGRSLIGTHFQLFAELEGGRVVARVRFGTAGFFSLEANYLSGGTLERSSLPGPAWMFGGQAVRVHVATPVLLFLWQAAARAAAPFCREEPGALHDARPLPPCHLQLA